MSSINKLDLVFEDNAFHRDLVKHLIVAVSDTAWSVRGHMKSMATEALEDQNTWYVDSADYVERLVFESGVQFIIFEVGAKHWLAFLDNFGTGSRMDTNNPFLSEYLRSPYFNRDRLGNGMAVVGRPEGEYVAPDFRDGSGEIVRHSKGRFEGVNLEQLINPRTGKPYFIPQAPKHWLEQGIRWGLSDLIENVRKAFSTFPYHKYLKGGLR